MLHIDISGLLRSAKMLQNSRTKQIAMEMSFFFRYIKLSTRTFEVNYENVICKNMSRVAHRDHKRIIYVSFAYRDHIFYHSY